MGWDDSVAFMPYGKKFQKHRRLFQEYLSRTKVSDFSDIQTAQARQLALNFAQGNQDREHILQK
jgi:hypothetical protein